MTKRNWRRLLAKTEEARRDERSKFGETVFLLEPNVKRSRGGLRDLQFIRWIGFIRYGENDFDALTEAGMADEGRAAAAAGGTRFFAVGPQRFAFSARQGGRRARADGAIAHRGAAKISGGGGPVAGRAVHAGVFSAYERRAGNCGTSGGGGCNRGARWWWFVEPLVSHQFEGDFRVGPTTISATRRGLAKVRGDLAEVLRLLGSGQSVRQADRARDVAGDSHGDAESRAGRSRAAVAARSERAVYVAAGAAAATGRIAPAAARLARAGAA